MSLGLLGLFCSWSELDERKAQTRQICSGRLRGRAAVWGSKGGRSVKQLWDVPVPHSNQKDYLSGAICLFSVFLIHMHVNHDPVQLESTWKRHVTSVSGPEHIRAVTPGTCLVSRRCYYISKLPSCYSFL